jgi:eukaryotic-like serine/threonine-protein kinase
LQPARSPRVIRFGAFELDLRARELRKDGLSTGLPEQSVKILVLLLENPGEVVLREDIRKKLWPNDTVVEFDHSINAAIKRLRQAIGDSADNPQFIETLARRGYRWLVAVERDEPDPLPSEATSPTEIAPPVQSLIGRKVSHYRVLEILGGGGMGVVYKAEDLKLGRRVALKFLPEELASDPGALQRFESEARSASALNHPNICTIYGVEEYQGQPFLVMELLEGQTLRDLIAKDAPRNPVLELTKLLDLTLQITAGLEAAHRQGIIHRDIKPANIFITSQGQAKILDFGLAKLSLTGTAAPDPPTMAPPGGRCSSEPEHGTESLTASSPFLSRTGVAMGTAGYMSPEQVRGEKLDARTDLFSFGLVLHEMATGELAFKGDKGSVLQKAILDDTPAPARELNPQIPLKLEKIIKKALVKDRSTRYQTAAEILADLETVKKGIQPRRSSAWAVLAAGVIVIPLAMAIFWYPRHNKASVEAHREPKLRQLTVNSFENPVQSGAISPDGKYLAYSDTSGIRLQLVATNETRSVPPPAELKGKNVNWEIVATWFPDSTRFIVNCHPASEGQIDWSSLTSSIWLVSVLGGPPTKLRENAIAFSVSPSGSSIAFGTSKGKFGEREIWLMELSGKRARKLFDTDEESAFGGLIWSSDPERILYYKTDKSGDALVSRDLNGDPPTTLFDPSEMKQATDFFWAADGRLVYSATEPGGFVIGGICNFWEMRLDAHSGIPSEKPKKLTDWAGFTVGGLSETSDGKQLTFLKSSANSTSYLADLASGGTAILRPKHFPLSESSEFAFGWAPDSKAIYSVSDRSGQQGIYRHSLDHDTVELVVAARFLRDPQVTPDGNHILYLGPAEYRNIAERGPEPVTRVSITGGPQEQLFIAKPVSYLACARFPSGLCVLGEPIEDGRQLAVSVLDPVKGRGPELFRFPLGTNDYNWFLDLSPDGTRVAVTRNLAGPIYILSLHGEVLQQVQVKEWSDVGPFTWAADGNGLYVTAHIGSRKEMMHVDLQGNAHPLWELSRGSFQTIAHASPDGRHLVFYDFKTTANMWLMENF